MLTTDGRIRGLNRRWRGKDRATDVLRSVTRHLFVGYGDEPDAIDASFAAVSGALADG